MHRTGSCTCTACPSPPPPTLPCLPRHPPQICPILSDVVQSMAACDFLPPDFPGKEKTKAWYLQLYQMPASHELSEEQVRQMLYDLEAAMAAFRDAIK
jgi:ESCRT-I complex subunit VPS28